MPVKKPEVTEFSGFDGHASDRGEVLGRVFCRGGPAI
jgi:hypothetical protein